MNDSRDTHQDSAGCLRDLRAALARPELREFDRPDLPSEEARAAAYRLAVALGRYRLFCPQEARPADCLPPRVAVAAAEILQRHLKDWADDVRNLPQDWAQADDPVEASDLCLGLLRARMRGWAAWLAIGETDQDGLERTAADLGTPGIIDRLLDALDSFDAELQQQADLLSVAANTNLLDNWRALLAPPHSEELPWWLDGTLEEAARHVEERALASQPDESVGRRLREKVHGWLSRERSLAAAEQREPQYLPPLRWRSKDGAVVARLEVPAECGEDEPVVVTFEGEIPRAGTPVWLASVPSEIDSEGKASFLVRDLYAAARAPELEVYEERAVFVQQDN